MARHRSPGAHGPSAETPQASPHACDGVGRSHRLVPAPRAATAATDRRVRRFAGVPLAVLGCVVGILMAAATPAEAATAPRLLFSSRSDHSSPTALSGATVARRAFVFVQPGRATVQHVVFTLDPGTPTAVRVDRSSPFDFGGPAANGGVVPLDVSGLAPGTHKMTAVAFSGSRQRRLSATFTVARPATTGQTTTTSAPTTTTTAPATTTTTAPSTTTTTTSAPTTTAPPATTAPQAGTCTNPVFTASGNDDMREINGYFVHNNVWNPVAGGSQKISACSEKSWFVQASNFPDNNFEVFSYPNVHQDMPNYPNGVPVSGLSTVSTSFAGVPQAKGNYNVAYDIWLNGVGNGNGSTELMIWTETRPQPLEPLGTDQGDFTINGVVYDVYHLRSGGLNVVSYKARSAVRSGTFDLKQIIGDGVTRGFIPANPRLSSVDYGIEYRFTDGTSRFDVSNFSVTAK